MMIPQMQQLLDMHRGVFVPPVADTPAPSAPVPAKRKPRTAAKPRKAKK